MSKQNYTCISDNSCPIKDEADKCPDLDSIQLGFVKDEITMYQDNDDNYQSYNIEGNVINNTDNMALESFKVDASNVLDIKTEKDDTQNSILIIEDSFLVKAGFDIKKEISTFVNNNESNETYRTENITVNNDKSSDITIDTLKACVEIVKDEITTYQDNDDNYQSYNIEDNVINNTDNMALESFKVDASNVLDIKTEKDDTQNSILIIEDSFLVKAEFDIKKEISTFVNNDESNETYRTENITVNNDKSSDITIDTLKACVEIVKDEITTYQDNDDNYESYNIEEPITNCDKKPIKCNICYKSLSTKQTLRYHMFTHADIKPFTCDRCQKSYTKKSSLKGHMNTHTNEKLYKCNICLKSFRQNGSLKNHIICHTGQKPFKCDICQKSFARQPYLKTHVFTHADIKPYKCDSCEKSFTRKSGLKGHMFKYHKNVTSV